MPSSSRRDRPIEDGVERVGASSAMPMTISLLRMGAFGRLAMAGVAIAAIWTVIAFGIA